MLACWVEGAAALLFSRASASILCRLVAGQEAIGVLQQKPEEWIPGKGVELLLTEGIHQPGLGVVVDQPVDEPRVSVPDAVVQGGHDHEIVHRQNCREVPDCSRL